jgi:hypothetical protein
MEETRSSILLSSTHNYAVLAMQGPHSAILWASLGSSRAARQTIFNNRQPWVSAAELVDLTFAAHTHQPPEWAYEIGFRAMPGM